MTIEEFRKEHQDYLDMLLDDTWLCDEPIDERETRATWYFALHHGYETVPEEDFEKEFGLSFQDVADWWNKDILKVI